MGRHTWEEIFSNGGYMFKLWRHFSSFKPIIFDCLDFTLVHSDNSGEMICAIDDDLQQENVGDLKIVDFEYNPQFQWSSWSGFRRLRR